MNLVTFIAKHGRQPGPRDEVYIVISGSWEPRYDKGIVVARTPTGMLDVVYEHQIAELSTLQLKDGAMPMRFDNRGNERGVNSPQMRHWLDFDVAGIERQTRQAEIAEEAVDALLAVKADPKTRRTWGLDSLEEELSRLEKALAEARSKVEALRAFETAGKQAKVQAEQGS